MPECINRMHIRRYLTIIHAIDMKLLECLCMFLASHLCQGHLTFWGLQSIATLYM